MSPITKRMEGRFTTESSTRSPNFSSLQHPRANLRSTTRGYDHEKHHAKISMFSFLITIHHCYSLVQQCAQQRVVVNARFPDEKKKFNEFFLFSSAQQPRASPRSTARISTQCQPESRALSKTDEHKVSVIAESLWVQEGLCKYHQDEEEEEYRKSGTPHPASHL